MTHLPLSSADVIYGWPISLLNSATLGIRLPLLPRRSDFDSALSGTGQSRIEESSFSEPRKIPKYVKSHVAFEEINTQDVCFSMEGFGLETVDKNLV